MRTSQNNIMSCFLLLFGYQFEGTVPYLWKIRDRSVRNVILFRHHSKSLTFLVRADSIFSTVIVQFDLFFKSIVVVRVSNCLGSVSLSFYTSFECYEYLVCGPLRFISINLCDHIFFYYSSSRITLNRERSCSCSTTSRL